MANILISGGSGLVGRRLSELLRKRGDEVTVLSREAGPGRLVWDVEKGILDANALAAFDHIVHLAGAGIADKAWTTKRKKELIDSRVQSTRLLVDAISWLPKKPKSFISASAIGYYGDVPDGLCTEDSPAGSDFLANLCQQWEATAQTAAPLLPVSILRIGIVLSTRGGALPKLMLPFRFFAGTLLGSGKQFMSWIHIDDLCGSIIHMIDHPELAGTYNAVAPIPETHYTFLRALGLAMKRPLWMWVPGGILRLLLGEMATTILTGQQVSNEKLMQSGYQFQYGNIHKALKHLLQTKL